MSNRIAIISKDGKYLDNIRNTVAVFKECRAAGEIVVYSGSGALDVECAQAAIPSGLDSDPKIRNWINAQNTDFPGFLHVISDSVEMLKDPAEFLADLENMMSVLDYTVWFSTVTDGCNYIYQKYNPRMRISCDREETKKLGLDELVFTSHSNTQWVSYNMPALAGTDLTRFDERFTVPMFFIIEFLARRRNTKKTGQLFYMNQYMTVKSEYGVFKNLKSVEKDETPPETMKSEDAAFREMNVSYAPDNNVDMVLEDTWKKMLEKSA